MADVGGGGTKAEVDMAAGDALDESLRPPKTIDSLCLLYWCLGMNGRA
jgi:hypothetical protein